MIDSAGVEGERLAPACLTKSGRDNAMDFVAPVE